MKSEEWAPRVDTDSKKCQIQMVHMTKNPENFSFYYILQQPKGVPTPRDNFPGTGGTLLYVIYAIY